MTMQPTDKELAKARELMDLHAEPIPVAVEDGRWFMVREQDALDAVIAALRKAKQDAEGEVVVTSNWEGDIVMVSRQDDEGRVLSIIAQRGGTPASAECSSIRERRKATPASASEAVERDAQRLNAIAEKKWGVEPFEIPTGYGDADVGWKVCRFDMPNSHVIIAEVYRDDLRAVIDTALAAQQQESGS